LKFVSVFVKPSLYSSPIPRALVYSGAESDLSLVGAYGYETERNRGLIALLVLVAGDGSLAVPPTKVMVPVPRGAREGADAIARLKDANGDFVRVVRSTPREPSGSPTSERISKRGSDMWVGKR